MTAKFRYYILFLMISGILFSCKPKKENFYKLGGETMGTYYAVSYGSFQNIDTKPEIDSLLYNLNLSFSTYIPNSTISKINNGGMLFGFDKEKDPFFKKVYDRSLEIYQKTNGAFDPTVMPLVNYWGFGYKGKIEVKKVDSLRIDSLKKIVGFDKVGMVVSTDSIRIIKASNEVEIDFSAIAKGYAVDKIAELLESKGIVNYLVDIGGEGRSRGINSRGTDWIFGINKPVETAAPSEVEIKLKLDGNAIATSGNYRNFYESDGKKYGHTINPGTGFPEISSLLSASIIAKDCTTADGYATACMVLGLEKAMQLINNMDGVEACFIYDEDGDEVLDVTYTEGFSKYIIQE